MKRKIYLASSWRNHLQPDAVYRLRMAGHEVYDFRNPGPGEKGFSWSEVDKDWRYWASEHFIKGLEHPYARHGFQLDKVGLDWADTCVLLSNCGKSAHLEAGYAIGQGKETFIVLEHKGNIEAELMYLLAGYGHVLATMDDLLERLQGHPSPVQLKLYKE